MIWLMASPKFVQFGPRNSEIHPGEGCPGGRQLKPNLAILSAFSWFFSKPLTFNTSPKVILPVIIMRQNYIFKWKIAITQLQIIRLR